jgi:hypothetical protein
MVKFTLVAKSLGGTAHAPVLDNRAWDLSWDASPGPELGNRAGTELGRELGPGLRHGLRTVRVWASVSVGVNATLLPA